MKTNEGIKHEEFKHLKLWTIEIVDSQRCIQLKT